MPKLNQSFKNTPSPFFIFLFQIFQEYQDKFARKIFKKPIIKPWMRYREIEIVEEILKNLQPGSCLEWGAGYSTLYFPRFLTHQAKWVSLEHEKSWALKISKLNQNPRVKIIYIKPNRFPWTDKYQDGAYSDLKDYIDYPTQFKNFHFILVDGRARKACLIKAHEIISDQGIIVLHDANRRYYHSPFKLYKEQVLFSDYQKNAGGLWIGSKKVKIKEVLPVNKYKKVWGYYHQFGKFLRV